MTRRQAAGGKEGTGEPAGRERLGERAVGPEKGRLGEKLLGARERERLRDEGQLGKSLRAAREREAAKAGEPTSR